MAIGTAMLMIALTYGLEWGEPSADAPAQWSVRVESVEAAQLSDHGLLVAAFAGAVPVVFATGAMVVLRTLGTSTAHPEKSRAFAQAREALWQADFVARVDDVVVINLPTVAWLDAVADALHTLSSNVERVGRPETVPEFLSLVAATKGSIEHLRATIGANSPPSGTGTVTIPVDITEIVERIMLVDIAADAIEADRRLLPRVPKREPLPRR